MGFLNYDDDLTPEQRLKLDARRLITEADGVLERAAKALETAHRLNVSTLETFGEEEALDPELLPTKTTISKSRSNSQHGHSLRVAREDANLNPKGPEQDFGAALKALMSRIRGAGRQV